MVFNLSAISKSTIPGRLLRLPLRLIPAGTVMPILQGPLARRRWIVGSGVHGYWLGSYELDKQQHFARASADARVVWDVGAHVGFYTLVASVSVKPPGQVVAFEPSPRNVGFLREHLRLNGCTNTVVCPFAVSDRSGSAPFEQGPSSSMGRIVNGSTQVVQVVTVDDLVDAGTIPPPDLMKIDVEGEEARVLAGAVRTIAASSPTIFLATHSAELHRLCQSWLEARGYQLTALSEDELIARPGIHRTRDAL